MKNQVINKEVKGVIYIKPKALIFKCLGGYSANAQIPTEQVVEGLYVFLKKHNLSIVAGDTGELDFKLEKQQ